MYYTLTPREIAARQFVSIPMLADGNCLFSSVACCVYGNAAAHMRVREECYDFIMMHADHYANIDPVLIPDLEAFVALHRQERQWGGTIELDALARLYGCIIVLYTYKSMTEIFGRSGPVHYIYYNGVNHFDALAPMEGVIPVCPPIPTYDVFSFPDDHNHDHTSPHPNTTVDLSLAVRESSTSSEQTDTEGVVEERERVYVARARSVASMQSDTRQHVAPPTLTNNAPTEPVNLDDPLDPEELPMPLGEPWTEQQLLETEILLSYLPQHRGILHKSVSEKFNEKLSILALNWVQESSSKNLFLLLAFPTVVCAPHITRGSKSEIIKRIRAYPNVRTCFPVPKDKSAPMTSRIEQVKKLMTAGRPGAAFRILSNHDMEDVPLPSFDRVRDAMQELHPRGPPHSFGSAHPQGRSYTVDEMRGVLNNLKTDSAAGPSGWSAFMVRSCRTNDIFIQMLTKMANQISLGVCEGHDLLCLSRLIALPKPNGKLRPIAVGEIFLRIISRLFLAKGREQGDLLPLQLGVGTLGGCEPIIHGLQHYVTTHRGKDMMLVSLDISNAFNTLSRQKIAEGLLLSNPRLYNAVKWIYDTPSPLVLKQGGDAAVLFSDRGVRQGCVLAPFLYSVGSRAALQKIDTIVQSYGGRVMAYLDDTFVTIPVDGKHVSNIFRDTFLSQIDSILESYGLRLNTSKCVFKTVTDAFDDGFDVLGSRIGCGDAQSIFLQKHVSALNKTLTQLHQLPAQQAMYLFRYCVIPQTNHLARTLLPSSTSHLWELMQSLNHEFVKSLCQMQFMDFQSEDMIHLPLKYGGWGIPNLMLRSESGYAASQQTCVNLSVFVRDHGVQPSRHQISVLSQSEMMTELIAPVRDRILVHLVPHAPLLVSLVDFASTVGRAFWRVLPLDGTCTIPDSNFVACLRERLLLPPDAPTCASCHLAAPIGHQFVCSKGRQGVNQTRHKQLLNLCARSLTAPNHPVETELLSPVKGNLRMDIRVTGPRAKNGHISLIDVTVVSNYSVSAATLLSQLSPVPTETLWSFARRCALFLRADAGTAKSVKYRDSFVGEFVPLVFLPCGAFDDDLYPWLRCPGWVLSAASIFARSKSGSK